MNEVTYSHDLIARGSNAAQEVKDGLKQITAYVGEIKTELEDEFRNYDEVQKSLKKTRGIAERLKVSVIAYGILSVKYQNNKRRLCYDRS